MEFIYQRILLIWKAVSICNLLPKPLMVAPSAGWDRLVLRGRRPTTDWTVTVRLATTHWSPVSPARASRHLTIPHLSTNARYTNRRQLADIVFCPHPSNTKPYLHTTTTHCATSCCRYLSSFEFYKMYLINLS